MRLWLKITIAVLCLSIFSAVALSVFVNKQFKRNLDEINFELSKTLTKSISDSMLDYVLEGNTVKTQEVLRRITKGNEEIEYIAVVDFNNKLFASSIDIARLPDEIKKNKSHILCVNKFSNKEHKPKSKKERMIGSQTYSFNGSKVYDYAHPFVENLSAHIHFGLKNSLYKNSVSNLEHYSLFIIVIIFFVGIAVAYMLGKKISKPIEQLSEVVSNFGKTGEYTKPDIQTTDKDVIGLLESFDKMLVERYEYEEEIYQYKENLETLVKDRTEKLEKEIKLHEETEEKLKKEKEISDKANKVKSEFLSHMSHELRTPLNAVIGFSQLLEISDDDDTQDYAKEILRAGHHLLALINDILELSKIEAGRLELSIEEVNWNEVIDDCYVLLKSEIKKKNINYCFDNDNKYYIVKCDRVRLKQAVLNLMSNAVKYNEQFGILKLSFDLMDSVLRLSVKDSGIGISEKKQYKVFTPFERLDLDKSAIEGVGIGLVVTKALVEGMNGSIGFNSKLGFGSVFWLEFNLERIEDIVVVSENESKPVKSKNIGAAKTKYMVFSEDKNIKILYIEDNPSNMKMVEKAFERFSNIDFFPALSPSEGFKILDKITPDVILLDIHLPEMDGFSVKNILDKNEKWKDIPVIGLSANAMKHDIEKAENKGFIHYLAKPIDMNVLVSTIEKVLGNS